MIKKILLTSTIVLLTYLPIYCQSQDTLRLIRFDRDTIINHGLSVVVGYNFWSNHFIEIGLGLSKIEIRTRKVGGGNIYLTTEMKLAKNFIYGPKLGFWLGNGTGGGIGLNLIYYTDSYKGSLRLRPEIGFGISLFKLVYGYNLALSNQDFEGINQHNIGLHILLTLKSSKKRKS